MRLWGGAGGLRRAVAAAIAAILTCAVVVGPAGAAAAPPSAAPYCAPGQQPAFLFGFAYLKSQVGDPMGDPIECEHKDPGSGYTVQHTTTGLAVYRPATNLVTFTNGYEHWAATPDGIVTWTGTSADPPAPPPPAPSPAPTAPAPPPPAPAPAKVQWLQALTDTPIWSGPDKNAVQLGTAQQWDYFQQLAPQTGSRIMVKVIRTGGPGWVDASAVGPSGPPPAGWPPAPAPAAPPASPSALPADTFTVWHGVVREGGAYRRSAPSTSATVLEDLSAGTPIRIDGWVAGPAIYPDVIAWGQVDPADGGGFIYGGALAGILPPAVPPPPPDMASSTASWIDVNLTLNVVTAYQDGHPLKVMLASPGRPGWGTATGVFKIGERLNSQEMIGPGYDVPGVPWVQYFAGADALHGRYWTLPSQVGTTSADPNPDGSIDQGSPISGGGPNVGVAFGVPSSHGCVGLEVDDAAWLYQFARLGVVVDSHD